MKKQELHKIMSQVDNFPVMPSAAGKLMKLLDDPGATPAQIEEVLRYDPGLTANILRLVNSAYIGLPAKVGSVRQGIALIGMARLKKLAMATFVTSMLKKDIPGYDLPAGELWRHSIAVSVTAESLQKELQMPDNPEIFTAALLHDVGKLVLGHFVKDDLAKIEAEADKGIPFDQAERNILGTDHAEVGAMILNNWSFPKQVVTAVKWHHDPENAPGAPLILDLVHVANMLCMMIGIGVGREGLQHQPSPVSAKRLGLRPGHLEMVASKTLEWVRELSDAI